MDTTTCAHEDTTTYTDDSYGHYLRCNECLTDLTPELELI